MEESGRAVVAEIASSQWGLITTAQAEVRGVGRMLLSRMASSGELDRVMHGVYVATSNAGDPHQEVRAHWIALDPGKLAADRLAQPHTAGVVSHTSAAALHGVGDLPTDDAEFTLPERHRTRRPGTRFHRAQLRPSEVTLVDGLPVTTPARTIADLLLDGHDMSHVAEAVADTLNRNLDSAAHLVIALDAIAPDLNAESGTELLHELLAVVGMDPGAVLERIRSYDLMSLLGGPSQEAARNTGLAFSPQLRDQMQKSAEAIRGIALSGVFDRGKFLGTSPAAEAIKRSLVAPNCASLGASVDLSRLLTTYTNTSRALSSDATHDGPAAAGDEGER